MCGVIGLIFEKHRDDLGHVAAELLRQLEYRGYDSTGAAVQGGGTDVKLAKGVGAPSALVEDLGIVDMAGSILCGQVRWATFGAVDALNAQPHEMRCKVHLYGAHNGNVTNCDDLKRWLVEEGHDVKSDNDGEMVVHTVEHLFARELGLLADTSDAAARRGAMRRAISGASVRLRGSFAAVVVDPVSRVEWAIKRGSSLYFGYGIDPKGGAFGIASSDLSAVLKLTRVLLPLSEGEFVEYDAGASTIYRLGEKGGEPTPLERAPIRSRLRAKDTALVPPFETFMDQEISAQERTCSDVVRIFMGGSDAARRLRPALEELSEEARAQVYSGLEEMRGETTDAGIRSAFLRLVSTPAFSGLAGSMGHRETDSLVSSEAGFLADIVPMARDADDRSAVGIIDAILECEEVVEHELAVERFLDACEDTIRAGGRLFAVSCGSSYHAAKAAAQFFNEVAHVELIPILPGEFRGQHARSLRDGDLFLAVSQSGETKDLIDILNDVRGSGKSIRLVGLVNNVNSTIGQEKCDLVLPLRCGPEIAVPATKSFMNQMAVAYCLALRLGERRVTGDGLSVEVRGRVATALEARLDRLPRLPALIRETFDSTDADVEQAARLLYLRPSLQILATRITAVAQEGALKVREVVLNHTEGFEGSEFKHGPNTILGVNTVHGPEELDALMKAVGRAVAGIVGEASRRGWGAETLRRLVQAATDGVFSPATAGLALSDGERSLLEEHFVRDELLGQLVRDYPLVYITGPDERDVQLTVSQINTHKIRGSQTVVIAEEHPDLRQAATKAPAGNADYRAVVITLPRTHDTLMTVFSATVVLQRLALKMSLLKAAWLDRIGLKDHGVHPDVPKNVSKSITVD